MAAAPNPIYPHRCARCAPFLATQDVVPVDHPVAVVLRRRRVPVEPDLGLAYRRGPQVGRRVGRGRRLRQGRHLVRHRACNTATGCLNSVPVVHFRSDAVVRVAGTAQRLYQGGRAGRVPLLATQKVVSVDHSLDGIYRGIPSESNGGRASLSHPEVCWRRVLRQGRYLVRRSAWHPEPRGLHGVTIVASLRQPAVRVAPAALPSYPRGCARCIALATQDIVTIHHPVAVVLRCRRVPVEPDRRPAQRRRPQVSRRVRRGGRLRQGRHLVRPGAPHAAARRLNSVPVVRSRGHPGVRVASAALPMYPLRRAGRVALLTTQDVVPVHRPVGAVRRRVPGETDPRAAPLRHPEVHRLRHERRHPHHLVRPGARVATARGLDGVAVFGPCRYRGIRVPSARGNVPPDEPGGRARRLPLLAAQDVVPVDRPVPVVARRGPVQGNLGRAGPGHLQVGGGVLGKRRGREQHKP